MSPRRRYSGWALLAGITGSLCVTNGLILFAVDQRPTYRWVNRHFANRELAQGLLFTAAMGWGPASLVLSEFAMRQIRHNPDMRGKWIARLAMLVGAVGSAFFVLAVVVLIAERTLGRF